jgi:hypothetical protein
MSIDQADNVKKIGMFIEAYFTEIDMSNLKSQLLEDMKTNPNFDVRVRADSISVEEVNQQIFISKERLAVGCRKFENEYNITRSDLITTYKKLIFELKLDIQMISINFAIESEMEAAAHTIVSSSLAKLLPDNLTEKNYTAGFNWMCEVNEKLIQLQIMANEDDPKKLIIYPDLTFKPSATDIETIEQVIQRESDYLTDDLIVSVIKSISNVVIEG